MFFAALAPVAVFGLVAVVVVVWLAFRKEFAATATFSRISNPAECTPVRS